MCTVIVSVERDSVVPVLLVGVRDEFADRPWEAPGRHWERWPGLIGGRDLQAGGTWLAADPSVPRVAALLNGRGVQAAEATRRSRGDLPLRAAAAGELDAGDLAVYDPFFLVVAEPSNVRLWGWDGTRLTEVKLPDGPHIIVNSGWERGDDNPRVAWFRPLFAASRPSPLEDGWGDWLEPASGGGLPATDPRALVVRHELGDGRVWGTSSITLVALSHEGIRYDFSPRPGDPSSWYRVA